MTVTVRYCGGCNPRYDRVALVARLMEACPGCRFTGTGAGGDGGVVLVVCGCAAACADRAGLKAPLILTSAEGLDAALARIKQGGPD